MTRGQRGVHAVHKVHRAVCFSHSLAQLKHVLESQGVSVDKLHVTQTPRDQQADNDNNRQQPGSDNPSARQEQQRREILQRMWRKLANGSDPLDMVA